MLSRQCWVVNAESSMLSHKEWVINEDLQHKYWCSNRYQRHLKLRRRNEDLVQKISVPKEGSKELHFDTQFSRSTFQQFQRLLWKFNIIWWRTPEYNATRMFFTIIFALVVSRYPASHFLSALLLARLNFMLLIFCPFSKRPVLLSNVCTCDKLSMASFSAASLSHVQDSFKSFKHVTTAWSSMALSRLVNCFAWQYLLASGQQTNGGQQPQQCHWRASGCYNFPWNVQCIHNPACRVSFSSFERKLAHAWISTPVSSTRMEYFKNLIDNLSLIRMEYS